MSTVTSTLTRPPLPLLIKNGLLVNADRSWHADILCIGGKIAAIGQALEPLAPLGTQHWDAHGHYVMPGGIDPHTYLATADSTSPSGADTMLTGSMAALAGGTTTLIDTLRAERGQSLLEAFHQHRHRAANAVCGYGLHATITDWNDRIQDEVATLIAHGINSFSHSMGAGDKQTCDDAQLMQSFVFLLEAGAMPTLAAENGMLVNQLQQQLFDRGMHHPTHYPLAHPTTVEGEATQRAIAIAELVGAPLYLTHVSSQDAIEAIARAHQRGTRVYGEASIANLVLTEERYNVESLAQAALYITTPPLRDRAEQRALWQAIQRGLLHTVASRHHALSQADKLPEGTDFDRIAQGHGGIEERMALSWHTGIHTGRLTPSQFVALTATRSARLFHLYPRKGVICTGADADLVIWDPETRYTWSHRTHQSHSDYSLYEGLTVKGKAAATICMGHIAWQDGQLRVAPGSGQWLARPPFAPQCAVARAFHRRHKQI